MNPAGPALLGIVSFVIAGFVGGGINNSADPELILAAARFFEACGLLGVIAGGVAWGVRAGRQ